MPSKSKAQQAYMAIQLDKKRKGQKTDVAMSTESLEDFAGTKTAKLPEKVKAKKTKASKASY